MAASSTSQGQQVNRERASSRETTETKSAYMISRGLAKAGSREPYQN